MARKNHKHEQQQNAKKTISLLDKKTRKSGRPQMNIRNLYADALAQLSPTMKPHAELKDRFASLQNQIETKL
jgi:hypothetical protein